MIDHGASLYFHHRSGGWEKSATARFPQIKDHVLLPFAGDIAAAGARLAPLLTEGTLRAVVAALPDEWLPEDGGFASPAAYREAYLAHFLARLVGPRAFEQEACDAARAVRLV